MCSKSFLLGLFIALIALKAEAGTTKSPTVEEKPKFLGITAPQWLISVRQSLQNVIDGVKKFFSSQKAVSVDVFGRNVDLQRPKLPQDVDQIERRGKKFKHLLKSDPATRVLCAIYLNIAFIVAVYSYLFICHIMITLRSKRSQPEEKKKPNVSILTSTYRPPYFNRIDVEAGNLETEWNPYDPAIESQVVESRQQKSIVTTRANSEQVATLRHANSMESLSNSMFDKSNSMKIVTRSSSDFVSSVDQIQPPSSDHILLKDTGRLLKDDRRDQLINMPGKF